MSIVEGIEQTLRKIGGAANVALACGFAWAAVRLGSSASDRIAAAGGLPSLSVEAIRTAATAPEALSNAGNLAFAWGLGVASAGCAWMAVLGFRWTFHAALRLAAGLRG